MWESSAQFGIRLARLEDIPALHQLIEVSVRKLQANDYCPRQIDGALGTVLGMDTQLIRDGSYFVAYPIDAAGTLVACGGWSNRRTLFGSDAGSGRDTGFLDPHTDAARIRAIFVHPEWARRGLGTLMLEHCEAAAERAGFRCLEMGSTLTGVRLYRLRGYHKIEQVNVPLPNGEALPIIRMAKFLGVLQPPH